jgi:erythromycin esterase-like protein
VGVGTVSHGGYEPIAFQSKMIQYLVEKKGFKEILFELPDIELLALNSYLTDNSKNDIQTLALLLSKLIVPFPVETFYYLFSWIKNYNLAHPESMVHINGIDLPRSTPNAIINNILYNYLLPYDNEEAQRLIYKWASNPIASSDSIKVADIASWFTMNQKKIQEKLSPKEYNQLLFTVNTLKSNIIFLSLISQGNVQFYRDSIMAQNVCYWANHAKTIIWANNGHIFRGGDFSVMGAYLYQHYQKAYYTILTDFSKSATIFVYPKKVDTFLPINDTSLYKKYYPNVSSVASKMALNYGITQGIFFYDDLDIPKVGVRFSIFDAFGLQMHADKFNAFDALVVFDTITPDHYSFTIPQKIETSK